MRIIAGTFKGRKLITPDTDAIRPTSDRTREAVFNLLMHGSYGGAHIIDQHVVDLCCGTGALGIEALSRGARCASFIDKNKASLALTKQNVTHCGANAQAFFVQADAAALPPAHAPAALVMMDAPYALPLLIPAYGSLLANGWFEPNALIVAEQPSTAPVPTLEGAAPIDTRHYGKTTILIYKLAR